MQLVEAQHDEAEPRMSLRERKVASGDGVRHAEGVRGGRLRMNSDSRSGGP